MDYTTLGRTGLRVSVLGLGCGGFSRLGQSAGAPVEHSVAIVRRAMDLGVNFLDTAEAYRTEAIVGQAIAGGVRERVVLSTKKTSTRDGEPIRPADLVSGLEASLARLGTDRVDVYHLHAVEPRHYAHAREHLAPAMQKLRQQGKIRFLGITEGFASDPGHATLALAVQDDCWDVMMVGFNVLNQSARQRVLGQTQRQGIGVLNMFAVRSALSQPQKLRALIGQLLEQGLLDRAEIDEADGLGFLVREGGCVSLPDGAYRFCRAEPGIDVVLSGTGSLQHLEENVASILRPALPEAVRARLVRIFARVDTVSGQ